MRRTLFLISLAVGLVTLPASAATLINGNQINRMWASVNHIGLLLYGSATDTSLSASGKLIVGGATELRSTVKLNGVTYTFPYGDGTSSGKTLKTDGAGHLSWSTDLNTGGGTGNFGTGNVLAINQATDNATSTGQLIKNFKNIFLASSTGSLKTYFDSNYFRTSTGSLKAFFDLQYLRTSTGSLKAYFDLQYLRTSTGSLKVFFDANYFRTSTGSLQKGFDSRYLRTSGGTETGTVLFRGTASGWHLFAGTLSGAGLIDCQGTSNKVTYSATARRFLCEADQNNGGGGGITQTTGDARYVRKQGDTMTGGLLIVNGGDATATADAGVLLEVAGTMSGRVLKAIDSLATSGSLTVKRSEKIESGSLTITRPVGYATGALFNVNNGGLYYDATNRRFGVGTSSPSYDFHVKTLLGGGDTQVAVEDPDTSGANGVYFRLVSGGSSPNAGFLYNTGGTQVWDVQFDNSVTSQSLQIDRSSGNGLLELGPRGGNVANGHRKASTLLDVAGAISGATLFGSTSLATSGALVVDGPTTLKGTLKLNGVTYTFPASDGTATGKVLKTDGAGHLSWSSDLNTGGGGGNWSGTGALQTAFDTRYVNTSGDTMTGSLVLKATSNNNTIAQQWQTQDGRQKGRLTSSGALSLSGSLVNYGAVTFGGFTSCTNLQTSSNGALSCNNNVYLASSTGSLKTFFDANYLRTSTGSLKVLFDSLYFRTSTGSLRSSFDNRYLRTSGGTETGTVLFRGTASGWHLYAGTFSGAGLTDCNGAGNKVTYNAANRRFLCEADQNTGGGGGITQTTGDARYVNVAGDAMTGGLIITNGNPAATIDSNVLFEVAGTASGRILRAQDTLASSGTLTVKGDVKLGQGTHPTPVLFIDSVTGQASFGSNTANHGLEIANGDLLVSGGAAEVSGGTFTVDTNTFFVNDFNNRVGIRTTSPDTALEVVGVASGTTVFGSSEVLSSGSLVVDGKTTLKGTVKLNGVTYTFPYSDGTATGKVLKTDGAGHLSWSTDQNSGGGSSNFGTGNVITIANSRYVSHQGDAMTGGLLIVNGGHILPSIDPNVLLEVAGIGSGRILRAQDTLASSGTLVVAGATTLKGTLTLNGVTYTFPYSDGTATGKVLKTDGAGHLSWSTDLNSGGGGGNWSGTGALQNAFDSRYVNTSGDTLTGALVFKAPANNNTISQQWQTQDGRQKGRLTSSGALSLSGALVNYGAVTFAGVPSCTNLQTASNGALSCNNAVYLATSTGSLKVFFDANYLRTSTGSLKTLFDSLYFRTSTGSLQAKDDNRYVRTAGSTMTGALTHKLTGNNNTIDEQWKTQDGRVRATMTSSGSFLGSGRLVISMPKSATVDTATAPFSDYDIARFLGNNSGSFVDTIVQNYATVNATTDIVAQNSAASNTAGFIDMGFTSQTYNVANGGLIGPSEGYLYTPTAPISIGTGNSGSSIKFWIAPHTLPVQMAVPTSAEVMRIQGPGGYVGINTQGTQPKARLTVFGSGAFTRSLSGASLNVMNLISCANLQTSSNGALSCNNAAYLASSTGSLKTFFDNRYVAMSGDTMTGGLLIVNGGAGTATIDANTLLEIAGTASGRILRAQDTLASSGTLVIKGQPYFRNLTSCSFLQTTSSGALQCISSPQREIILSAGGGTPQTNSGSVAKNVFFSTNQINVQTQDFPSSGSTIKTYAAQWTALMPTSYNGGTLTAKFEWFTPLVSGNIKWFLQCLSLPDATTIDTPWGASGSVLDSATSTANQMLISGATGNITCGGTPAGGQPMLFRVYRSHTNDKADTLSGTGRLVNVKIRYGVSTLTE